MLRKIRCAHGLPLLLAALLCGAATAQSTWYVDVAATPPGDGSAQTPFTTIQAAVNAAAAGDHISVAPGEYVENVLAPEHTLHVASQAGPLATILRAAGPGPAFRSLTLTSDMSTLSGFTLTDSTIGLEDFGLFQADNCLIHGNDIGVRSHGVILWRCTVAGNDIGIQDAEYGVVAAECIVSLNTTLDYQGFGAFTFGSSNHCVGFQTMSVQGNFILNDTLKADALLWDLPAGNLHLQPDSPCIGYYAGGDVGALEFDPAYGADFLDLGGGLAGGPGTPVLFADGWMLAGTTVTLTVENGLPGGTAVLVTGLSSIDAPFKGGTLVPHPDLLIPLVLDGGGHIRLSFAWPASVPSGTAVWNQAWLPDAQGPQGYAASNGLKITTP